MPIARRSSSTPCGMPDRFEDYEERRDRLLSDYLEVRFGRIERYLRLILTGEEQTMASIADLDLEIKGELTDAVTAIDTKVTALEASIANGSDTSAQIAELHSLAGAINAVLAPAPAPATGGSTGTGSQVPGTGVPTGSIPPGVTPAAPGTT